jgi:hypothetical protein
MDLAGPPKKRQKPPRAPLPLHRVLSTCAEYVPQWSVLSAELTPLMATTQPPPGALNSRLFVSFACPCLSARGKPPMVLKQKDHIIKHFNTLDHRSCTLVVNIMAPNPCSDA